MNLFESFLKEDSSPFKSMPGHPYAFKAAYNYDNGHALKITYDISAPGFEVCTVGTGDIALNVAKNWIQFVRNVAMGDYFQMDEKERADQLAGLSRGNVRAAKEAEATVENVRKYGHLNFTGKGCPIVEIWDRVDHKAVTGPIKMIGPFSVKKKSPLNIPDHLLEEWHQGKLGNFELFSKGFRVDTLKTGDTQQMPTFMSTHWFDHAEAPMQVPQSYADKYHYELDDEGYAIDPTTKERVLFDMITTMIANVEVYGLDRGKASHVQHRDYNVLQGHLVDGKEDENMSVPGLVRQGVSVLTDRAAKPLATLQITKFDSRHNDIIAKLSVMSSREQLASLLKMKEENPSEYLVIQHIMDYLSKRRYAALHAYMNTIKPMWESPEDMSGLDFFESYLTEAPGDEGGPPPMEDPGMPPPMEDGGAPPDMGGAPPMEAPPDMGDMGGMDMGDDSGGLMGDPNADMSEGEGQDLNALLNLPEKVSAIMNLKLHERFLNLLNTIGSQLQSIKNNADVLNALSKDSIDVVNHLKRLDENVRLYLKNSFINENYSKNLLFFNKCLNLLKLLNDAFDRDLRKGIRESE